MVSVNNGCLVSENTALLRASHLPGKGRATLLVWVSEHFTFQKDKDVCQSSVPAEQVSGTWTVPSSHSVQGPGYQTETPQY